MADIKLEDGKYTVVNGLNGGGKFKALRHGEDWRDLDGDGLVLAMYHEIERLRKVEAEAHKVMRTLYEETRDDINFTGLAESLGMDDDKGTAE